jgi:alanyl-tRNA synthetase
MELCGGTHVARTGDIGYFRIINEGSSSAGVRRIEAVTGQDAYELAAEEARQLAELHALTKAQPGQVVQKVQSLVKEVKDLKGKSKKGGGVDANALKSIRDKAETVGDVTVYVAEVLGGEAPDLLTIKDALGQDSASSAIVLGSRGEGKALLVVAFSKDLVGRGLHAGKIVGEMARLVGGGGGGKPEIAQAGGKNPEGMSEALATGSKRIREALEKA